MDAYGTARLAAKDAESAIVARICEDFNMTTPEIAGRTYHSKPSVDRYIQGFERVRLLAPKHPVEELPLLTGMSANLVAQYLDILAERDQRRAVNRRRVARHG